MSRHYDEGKKGEYTPDPHWVAVPVDADPYLLEYAVKHAQEKEELERRWKNKEDTQ